MTRDRLIAVGGGLLCALLYLSVMTGSTGAIFFTYLSQLPLFLVGLSLGWTSAAIACIVAAGAIAVGANFAAAGLFCALSAAPVLILVHQGLQSRPGAHGGTVEWYPPGRLLGWLTGYGLVLFGITLVAFLGSEGGVEGAARAYVEATLGNIAAGAADPRFDRIIQSFIRYFPAVVVTTWLVMVVINAALAQNVLTHFKRNRRPSLKFTDLELPGWMTTGLAVVLLVSLVPGRIGVTGQNAAIIIVLPFFFLGLAVIHAVSHRFGARRLFLLAIYVILILFGWPIIVVAGLGIVEQWAHFRRRFAATGTGREIE
jgi:uncharacterized protein YybS (DUF2232 family)